MIFCTTTPTEQCRQKGSPDLRAHASGPMSKVCTFFLKSPGNVQRHQIGIPLGWELQRWCAQEIYLQVNLQPVLICYRPCYGYRKNVYPPHEPIAEVTGEMQMNEPIHLGNIRLIRRLAYHVLERKHGSWVVYLIPIFILSPR